jgi:hypothetical protein
VNEIEVNIPIYSEPDEYELLVISNFSQKSLNEDIIDGSLYLEFAKNPRSFYVIEEEEVHLNEEPEEPPALPPPIPPRPRKHSKGIYIIKKISILLYAPKLLLKILKRRYLM